MQIKIVSIDSHKHHYSQGKAFSMHCIWTCGHGINSLTIKKRTIKFSSVNLKKNIKSKLFHIENLEIRGQTV